MGDRDAAPVGDESDHDLRPVSSVVAAVAEGEGREALLSDGDGLEVARGDVVTDKTKIEVGEVAQLLVKVSLGGLFCLRDGVDRPVALVEARWGDSGGEGDRSEPLGDRDRESV